MKKIISFVLCMVMLVNIAFAAGNISFAHNLAEDLKALNLFFGVSNGNNFDLERAPTRIEALVMLIRVLGAEKEVLSRQWVHPFTDVPAWADNYVGYGYQNGLANGISLTRFGTGHANAAMYLTFVLRALGYTEAADGFTWDQPFNKAREVGILPERVDTENFLRADVVLVSYAALAREIKGTGKILAEKLISEGVFTKAQYDAYYDPDAFAVSSTTELNAEQVYQKCARSVFYIEVSDSSGKAYGSGSGFFITSDGIAVTNYHVIERAASAKIVLSDSQKEYSVAGVLNYSEQEDWAVIKVSGSGFTPLEIGDVSTVVGGANIYTIGSPLGLQNTISQGIISNVEREIQGTTYIQITAPISQGSSGGALINKYGQVIGITTGSMTEGQSLNLAVPMKKVKYNSSATVTSLAKLNSSSSGSSSSGSSSGSSSSGSGGTVSANDALTAIYQIATTHANFNYGDYTGYNIETQDGREAISLVYSRQYNECYIVYDFYSDSGARSNLVMQMEAGGTGVDGFTVSVYERNAENPLFRGAGNIRRSTFTANTFPNIDRYESIYNISAAKLNEYEKIAGYTTCLALSRLDEVLKNFTSNRIGVYQLGYTSFQN